MVRYDVCIIGGGAAGSVIAADLVDAGLEVVVVEQGRRVEPGMSYVDVLKAAERVWAEDGSGRRRPDGYPWSTCNLGGGTVFYGGVMWRYREIDFDCSRLMQGHDVDVRWPFDYAALAPHYDRIERDLDVSRSVGLDPCEPPTTFTARPPHAPSAVGRLLAKAGTSLGWRPFPTPLAVREERCLRGGWCVETRCESGAKPDAVRSYLDPRASAPNLEIRTSHKAVELVLDRKQRIAAVECYDLVAQVRARIEARVFVLAANAVQSAILLLRSRSRLAPRGIGNDNDLVGRGLTYKNSIYLRAVRRRSLPLASADLHGPCSTVSFTDFYLDPEAPNGLGGLIYEMAPGPTSIPLDWCGSSVRVECLIADRPSWQNRVYLSGERDALGLERPVLRYETAPLDARRLLHLANRAETLLRSLDVGEIVHEPSDFEIGSGHMHGTCRAGTDPRASVLDPTCRVHSVDNLFVADGAFMPWPGGLNPTLTIQANASRIAPFIRDTATRA